MTTFPHPRVCVAVGKPTMEEALQTAQKMSGMADVVEIRLDCIDLPDIRPFVETVSRPLLFTNRPTWEGGFFAGPETERILLLLDAVKRGAAYIDLELQSPNESLQRVREMQVDSNTQLILSRHFFDATPSRDTLVEQVHLMQEKGANIGKIVTMANTSHDVLQVLQLLEEAAARSFPLIAFCMGRAGKISRVATVELGGFMTYCAVDTEEATAPGQIAVADFRKIYELMHGKSEYSSKS